MQEQDRKGASPMRNSTGDVAAGDLEARHGRIVSFDASGNGRVSDNNC